jgi:diguanylate cyclase (GGDEF)-like protein
MSNVVIVFLLQAFGIIDMKQVLITTHISLLFSFFYLPFSIVHKLKKNGMSQRVMVALASLCTMLPPLAYSMWVYYSGAHNVADYGDLFFFIFIAIYAINVSLSLKKDLDAGREAAIYRELAEKDLLTGCYNRNAFRNDCADCDDLRDILVVVCDLNNLKKCNDTLGHACGDKYLTDSSRVLKNIFSRYGKVYRIGGDEFCIIIHHCYEMRIHGLIANMREEEDDYNAQATDIRMEIACGYAEYDPSLDSKMEDIVTRADANMYENKKALKKQPH